MGAVIGEILPLALGVAISPIPIIAAILMLLSPILPEQDEDASKPIQGVIQLVLGAGLLLLALRQWRGRPKAGEEPQMPKWMQAIDKVTFPVALGLGFLLSAINPKNLLMAAAAGLAIGEEGLAVGEIVVVIAVFTLLAASTVLVPVV